MAKAEGERVLSAGRVAFLALRDTITAELAHAVAHLGRRLIEAALAATGNNHNGAALILDAWAPHQRGIPYGPSFARALVQLGSDATSSSDCRRMRGLEWLLVQ